MYEYGVKKDCERLKNLSVGKHLCKLNKMPYGYLDTMDNARVCDIDIPVASTITQRYHKGVGGHKDNMILEVFDE